VSNDPGSPDNDLRSLPPDEKEQWIQSNVAKLRQALAEPETRKRVYALLVGEELGEDDGKATDGP
jgi:hypothetical protein